VPAIGQSAHGSRENPAACHIGRRFVIHMFTSVGSTGRGCVREMIHSALLTACANRVSAANFLETALVIDESRDPIASRRLMIL
jgi:hypothetical protein